MLSNNPFTADISNIILAHEYVIDKFSKCEYPNGRKYYGIIYCISGDAHYKFSSGEKCTLGQGDILWLSPSATYSLMSPNEFYHYTVNFEINAENSDMSFLKNHFFVFKSKNPDIYRQIMKKITSIRKSRQPGFEMNSIACLYELCAHMYREICENEYHTGSYVRISPAKEYLEKNFDQPLTLNMLANIVNMSPTHFRREWHRLYGESALQYRDKLRLSYAKEYLLSGYYTVGEVAMRCGFDDTNYFVRFFKKHTGISPGKYTKNFD